MSGQCTQEVLGQRREGPTVQEEGSGPPLTNQLQGQNAVWHCPLDVVVAGCCVIIPSEKVGHLDAKGGEDGSDGAAHEAQDEELKHNT